MYLIIDENILELLDYFLPFSQDTLMEMFSNSDILDEIMDQLSENITDKPYNNCIELEDNDIDMIENYYAKDNIDYNDYIQLLYKIDDLIENQNN